MSTLVRGVTTAVECFVAGVLDSIRFPHTAIFFVTSKVVRVRFMQCLILNGGIFLSSVLLADYVLTPAFHWLLDVDFSAPLSISWLPSTLSSLLLSVFYVVWVYPVYALSFLLNAIWYQDIADQAFLTRGHKQHTPTLSFQRWIAAMSEELYRLLLVTLFLVQLSLVSLLPVVGPPLATLHICWLYSLYSFEYKWLASTTHIHTHEPSYTPPQHGRVLNASSSIIPLCAVPCVFSGRCKGGGWRRGWTFLSGAGRTSPALAVLLRCWASSSHASLLAACSLWPSPCSSFSQ